MNLALKIRVATTIVFGVLLATALTLGVSTLRVSGAIRQAEQVDELVRGVFELDTLTREYIDSHGERPRTQWEWRYESLRRLLGDLSLKGPGQQAAALRLGRSLDAIGRLFGLLTARPDAASITPEVSAERERQIGGQLIAYEKAVISAAALLKDANRRRLLTLQRGQAAMAGLAGVIGLAAVLAQLMLFRHFVFRPLEQLRTGIEQVGRGDLDHRVGILTADEIGEVARAFDRMALNLKAITASRDELNREIAERARAERELALSNERLCQQAGLLTASNKELEAFSYSVSHDLRAPLRHISGFVDLLRRRASDRLDADSRAYLDMVADASHQMGQLIDDLLSFSRMGRATLSACSFNLRPLVDEVIHTATVSTDGRRIEWVIGDLPEVRGDYAMMRQVLANLVGNAIKYTRPRDPARIEICADTANPVETVICVRDNGVGFDMRYVDKLFGVFQRLHRSEEFEGTGIGLANVRRIVHRHGGRTWAEGEPDRGAAFYFTLPAQVGAEEQGTVS